MALGSAWGHDGLEYDGKEMRQHTAALTGGLTGVTTRDGMQVLQQTSPANTVKVAAGQIIVAASGSGLFGSYEVPNDADLTSPTFSSTGAQARTDRLIVRVTAGVPALEVVAGTPGAGTPAPPAVTGDNWEYLARIELPASTSTIAQAIIKDERRFVGPPVGHFPSTSLPSTPVAGQVNYEPDTKRLNVFDGTSWLPPFGVAWGIIGTPFEAVASDTARTASATTDMAMTGLAVRVDRLYRVNVHSRWSIGGSGSWELNFHVGGTLTERVDNINENASTDGVLTSSFLWKPSTATVNVDLRLVESTGTSTFTLVGAAAVRRQFWVEDIGPR